MRRTLALATLVLAACTPQQTATGPEAVVKAIYQTLETSKGQQTTPLSAIPMTAELDALIKQAEATAGDGAPVFDGDLAGNCQDCTDFSDLKIQASTTATPEHEAFVDANFKLFQNEPKHVQWSLVETPEGWRVDNIVSDGFDVRAIAKEVIATPPAPVVNTEGDNAVECIAYLSLATDALKKAAPSGDAAALETANAAWRKKAEAFFKPDELAQYVASSLAVFDDLSPTDLTAKSEDCRAHAPA